MQSGTALERICRKRQKNLVWHWPGSAWPPSSDSKDLFVVDGAQPGNVNVGVAKVDAEKFAVASTKNSKS